jgi:hypothetical protein
VELSTTKVQNTEMERKQDEINVKVNLMKVRQDCVYFCVRLICRTLNFS